MRKQTTETITTQTTETICNPELYGLHQENKEQATQELAIDDNSCQGCQSSCQSSDIVHYTESTEKEFVELAQKDKVNINLWVGTQQFRKHGYIICKYCQHISKKKECGCGIDEKQLMEQVQKYCEKNKNDLDKLRFLSIIIEELKNTIEKNGNDETLNCLEIIGVPRDKYKGFTITIKKLTDTYKGKKTVRDYWGALAFSQDQRQIFFSIGKDKSKYKEKIDAWLSKPENLARLRDSHKKILGLFVK